jgi:chromosome segregation ATPase
VDPRAKWRLVDGRQIPTHCQYVPCENPVEQTAGKRMRLYCGDEHRVAANAAAKRSGSALKASQVPARQVTYGDDVVSAYRGVTLLAANLKELAEQLGGALQKASDVRTAQALVDEAEQRLQQREAGVLAELSAEIQARAVAVDEAEVAREDSDRFRREAEVARQAQQEAEARAEQADRQYGERRAELELQMEALRGKMDSAIERAAERVEAAETALRRRELELQQSLEQVRMEVGRKVDDALERAARAEGARDFALKDLERTQGEADRCRQELERNREKFTSELEREKARGDEHVEEVRAALQARIADLQELADERKAERTRLAEQLAQSEQERRVLAHPVQRTSARASE